MLRSGSVLQYMISLPKVRTDLAVRASQDSMTNRKTMHMLVYPLRHCQWLTKVWPVKILMMQSKAGDVHQLCAGRLVMEQQRPVRHSTARLSILDAKLVQLSWSSEDLHSEVPLLQPDTSVSQAIFSCIDIAIDPASTEQSSLHNSEISSRRLMFLV